MIPARCRDTTPWKGFVTAMIRTAVSVLAATLLFCLGLADAGEQPNSRAMTVGECTAIGLSQSPRIVIATQRAIEAREKVAARRGIRLPQIEFRTEAQKYDWLAPNKRNILGGGTTDVYSALNLSMLLFSNGRAEANIDSATARFYAFQEDLRRARQDVALDVNTSYHNVLRLEAILASREEAVKQMEHYLTVARRKQDIGKAPKLDVLRAEVQLADVTQARLLTRNQLEVARLELLNAMGIQDQGVSVNPVKDTNPAPSFAEPDAFIQEALNKNPEYLKSQYLVQAAERDVRVARAEFGPNVSLIASYNREGSDIPDIANWNAGVALSVPLFTGGITRARVGEAKAVVEQNKSATELVSQRMTLAVRSAVLSTQDAAGRLTVSQKTVEQAQEALTIAQEKYAAGLGSPTEVIDTQVALVQAQTNYSQALYDGKVALAALDYAIGRDPVATQNTDPGAGRNN